VPNPLLRFAFRLLSAFAALMALVASGEARAQTTTSNITINMSGGGVTRTIANHTPTTFQYVISQADCLSADAFVFPYTATNFAGTNIEVWLASVDSLSCDSSSARDPAATGSHCIQLFSAPATMGGTITIPTSKIASAVTGVTAGCVDTNSNTQPRALSIYFMLTNAGTGDVAAENFTIFKGAQLDMLGPPAPEVTDSGPADTAISVNYTGSGVMDTQGFYIFCDPPKGSASTSSSTGTSSTTSSTTAGSTSAGSTSASSTGSAGGSTSASSTSASTATAGGATSTSTTAAGTTSTATGGSACSSGCSSSILVAGQVPSSAYICGQTTATGSSVLASGLKNGTPYAVGVAAFDNVGNIGPLSCLVCVTPEKTDDFFSKYREAGGQAGGCACSASKESASFGGLLAGAVVFVAAAKRRRARGRRR